MPRAAVKLSLLGALVLAGAAGVAYLETYGDPAQLGAQLRGAPARAARLRQVADRLDIDARRADLLVLDQSPGTGTDGGVRTTLLFVEYAPADGSPLPAKRLTFDGKAARVEALSLHLGGRFADAREPLRGRRVAFFTRLSPEGRPPEKAVPIDEPGYAPPAYRAPGPAEVSDFESALWQEVWKLAADPAYRGQVGVRAVQSQSPLITFEPGTLYTVTLDPDGELALVSEPLSGGYRAALDGTERMPRVEGQ